MSRRSSRLAAMRARQDPSMAAIRTDYGRTLLGEVRRLYAAADYAVRDERRRLLARAAAVHEHLRTVEDVGCAVR